MKKSHFLIATLLLLFPLSCHNSAKPAECVRRMEDIYGEILVAIQDTSASLPTDMVEALFYELADTLCSVMENTEQSDVVPRLKAQEMASYAVFLVADYGLKNGMEIETCLDKFNNVVCTWRARHTEDGVEYLKEIPYNIRRYSDREEGREMYIIAKTDYQKPSVILLPMEAVGGVMASFVKRPEGEFSYDFENAKTLEAEEWDINDGFSVNSFNSEEFMEALKTYDALFVMYFEEDGTHESAMVRLEGLQSLIGQEASDGR